MSWLDLFLDALSVGGGAKPSAAVVDLETWEEENDQLLPNNLTAEDIAAFEAAGWVVDLETGRLIPEEVANDYGDPVEGAL